MCVNCVSVYQLNKYTLCVANDRYKVEGVVDADPETVFSCIDPTPASPRAKWDGAIKELQIIEQLDKAIQPFPSFSISLRSHARKCACKSH